MADGEIVDFFRQQTDMGKDSANKMKMFFKYLLTEADFSELDAKPAAPQPAAEPVREGRHSRVQKPVRSTESLSRCSAEYCQDQRRRGLGRGYDPSGLRSFGTPHRPHQAILVSPTEKPPVHGGWGLSIFSRPGPIFILSTCSWRRISRCAAVRVRPAGADAARPALPAHGSSGWRQPRRSRDGLLRTARERCGR